jgi:hypothetical protein
MSQNFEAMLAEAESLCGRADDILIPDDNRAFDRADRLARKALKAFLAAAKLAGCDRERLPVLMRALHVAGTLEAHGAVCRIVRDATRCRPGWDDYQTLLDYWECSCWTGAPFPEPPPEGKDNGDRTPAPGQTSFLD